MLYSSKSIYILCIYIVYVLFFAFSMKYPMVILRLCYGYPTVRGYVWLKRGFTDKLTKQTDTGDTTAK